MQARLAKARMLAAIQTGDAMNGFGEDDDLDMPEFETEERNPKVDEKVSKIEVNQVI
jgi:hypothetical protein